MSIDLLVRVASWRYGIFQQNRAILMGDSIWKEVQEFLEAEGYVFDEEIVTTNRERPVS